jgi:hypothetical protein
MWNLQFFVDDTVRPRAIVAREAHDCWDRDADRIAVAKRVYCVTPQ